MYQIREIRDWKFNFSQLRQLSLIIFSESSAIEIIWKEFMKYHIPVFLVVVHCAICIPIYLLYEIVCDHCIPVSHESKLMANYKLVLGCIQAFVWPSLSHFFNILIYRRFSLNGNTFYTVGSTAQAENPAILNPDDPRWSLDFRLI